MAEEPPDFGDNTFRSPYRVIEARKAQFRASESQRQGSDRLKDAAVKLADAERAYRMKLTQRITQLHAAGMAITTCETVAKGEEEVANLRHARDLAKGNVESARNQTFTHSADRRGIDQLVDWSMRRELRTDTPPAGFTDPPPEPQG